MELLNLAIYWRAVQIMDNSQKNLLRNEIEVYAKSLGFDMVGFSPAKIENKYLEAFSDWLKNDRHADMSYMEKIEQRSDLSKLLPGAQSVIITRLLAKS